MNGPAMYTAVQHQTRDELLIDFAPLVKRIAYHLLAKLPPTVQVEDLIQAGMIGLLEAAAQYDSAQGASFRTYAGIRIRGSMLDEMRKLDWTPRSVHRKARQVAECVARIENETGRDAKDTEVTEALGITLDEYHQILNDVSVSKVFSFDQLDSQNSDTDIFSDNEYNPVNVLQKHGFKAGLADAIGNLSERDQLIMSLYYEEELNLKEIGEVLGVSESRVSQIHGRIMLKLRTAMSEWAENDIE
ncbi:MAG: RNA polymerase sigma factor FliA [Gammaproteobacteria bacterium]|nr:MAG: RNA polymerase sigma factor FliA [Gammaproteobacteria bacterium]